MCFSYKLFWIDQKIQVIFFLIFFGTNFLGVDLFLFFVLGYFCFVLFFIFEFLFRSFASSVVDFFIFLFFYFFYFFIFLFFYFFIFLFFYFFIFLFFYFLFFIFHFLFFIFFFFFFCLFVCLFILFCLFCFENHIFTNLATKNPFVSNSEEGSNLCAKK